MPAGGCQVNVYNPFSFYWCTVMKGCPWVEHLAKGGGLFQVFVYLPTKSTYVCLLNDPQLHHPAEVENKGIEQAVTYSGAASLQSSLSGRAQHSEWQHAMAPV